MNFNIFTETTIENLGWTLVHSIWQLSAVGLGLFIAFRLLRGAAPGLRYAVSVGALAVTFLLPAITLWRVAANDSPIGKREYTRADEGSGPPPSAPVGNSRQNVAISGQGSESLAPSTGSDAIAAAREFLSARFPTAFPFAVALWILGVAIFSLRLVGGAWQLQLLRKRGVEPLSDEWQARLRTIAEMLRVRKAVAISATNSLATPIAVGVLKPMILVPAGLFLQVDPRQLESIIAHELIHIRRNDQWVSVAQSIAETLFFYHPCVWWISNRIRVEREFAADAAVIDAFADDRVVYATALANLEEIRLRANRDAAPALAPAADGGNLMQRIERILKNKTEIRSANSAWSAGLALALISALLLAVFSFTPKTFVNAQKSPRAEKKIAIGFVSIPPLDQSSDPPKDADSTARLLIAKLQRYRVPAIGFVLGAAISDGRKLYPVRANIVRMWRDAGLEVGIGSFKHVWFYETPYDDYVAGVEKNEAVVKKILAEKNLNLRYFSYPYLNTGKSVEDRDRFERWLNGRGLNSVKYTVDDQEWMYSYAYDVARQDNDIDMMNEIRVTFVRYMDKMMDHYEAYSREMFRRDIAQTMVLTPSRLVTDSADDLFGMLRRRGYRFVPIDEAQADDAYKTPEQMVGKFGNSWFERWTFSQGRKLRDEPGVDAVAWDAWQKRKPVN